MRRLVLAVAFVTLAACQKSPSASFREASDLYAQNRGEEEAAGMAIPDFRDPRWEKVETLLAAVPADSADYLAARLLLAQVKPGQDVARHAKSRACYQGCTNKTNVCAAGCGCLLVPALMAGSTFTCYTDDPSQGGRQIQSPCLDRCTAEHMACVKLCPPPFAPL